MMSNARATRATARRAASGSSAAAGDHSKSNAPLGGAAPTVARTNTFFLSRLIESRERQHQSNATPSMPCSSARELARMARSSTSLREFQGFLLCHFFCCVTQTIVKIN